MPVESEMKPNFFIVIPSRISTFCCLVVLLLGMTLSGCGSDVELHSKLSADQSVEMLVALGRAGIEAERERTSSGRNEIFSVSVPRSNYQSALEVIHEYGLPSKSKENVEQLIKPGGLFPSSPQMSGLRIDHVHALEIERLLEDLTGVDSAKVIVRSQSVARNSRRSSDFKASASVLLRYSSGNDSQLPFSISEVQKIVSKSVPGILKDNISITTSKLTLGSSMREGAVSPGNLKRISPFAFRVPQQDYLRAKYQLVGILLLICFAGILLGWATGSILTRRKIIHRFNNSGFSEGSLFLETSSDSKNKAESPLLTDGESDA